MFLFKKTNKPTNLAPVLCDNLTVDPECHTCSDATGAGVISTVVDGEKCQVAAESTCRSGVCIAGFKSLQEKQKNPTWFFFWGKKGTLSLVVVFIFLFVNCANIKKCGCGYLFFVFDQKSPKKKKMRERRAAVPHPEELESASRKL